VGRVGDPASHVLEVLFDPRSVHVWSVVSSRPVGKGISSGVGDAPGSIDYP
jgi:hypothetical protein